MHQLRVDMLGDLILDAPDPVSFFTPSLDALHESDVLVGHVETPYTLGGEEVSTDVATPRTSPNQLAALGEVGLDVATLAGNHIADRGAVGVTDTIDTLTGLGIATAGAGTDLPSARRAAVVERRGRRVGVISVNCVGPDVSKATSAKAGGYCLDVHTVYGRPFGGPGGAPMAIETFAHRGQLTRVTDDIRALRPDVDLLIVAFHKGVLHKPAELADYERDISHAAVDAGADVVIGHHAHILKGIEVYSGRPIFHGLGNFVTVTTALSEHPDNSPERRAWARRRREVTGFDPDPAMPLYPFHPQSRNTMIAQIKLTSEGMEAGFVPCWIDEGARPVPITDDAGGQVVEYVATITREAGLDTPLHWDGRFASIPLTR